MATSVKTKTRPGGVAWTKRQRARLFGSPHPQPIDPVLPDGDTAWNTLCELYGAPDLYPLPDDADRAGEPVLEAIRAEFRAGKRPASSTPERELLRFLMLMIEGASAPDHYKNLKHVMEALVPLWVGWGLDFASRVVWTEGRTLGGVSCGAQRRAHFTKHPTSRQTLGRTELWWLHLRRAVLAASPADYETARQLWQDLGVDPCIRAAVFCRAPDEAHALATRELRRNSPTMGSIVLLSAITDPALALRLAEAQPLNYACGAEFHAFHVVDNLGPAAAPVLLALLVRVSSGGDARKALAAAAVLADPDFCAATLPTLTGPAAKSLASALK